MEVVVGLRRSSLLCHFISDHSAQLSIWSGKCTSGYLTRKKSGKLALWAAKPKTCSHIGVVLSNAAIRTRFGFTSLVQLTSTLDRSSNSACICSLNAAAFCSKRFGSGSSSENFK
jgi:hypothetical protein